MPSQAVGPCRAWSNRPVRMVLAPPPLTQWIRPVSIVEQLMTADAAPWDGGP
jgi:hypothetical protein